ncbi:MULTISPECIES: tellurite resistance TerB family protein [Pseudovibrio]|uniref:tellurite resistance TerB family protein n=1 Tax=Stappiaceae TaxID=2821832 RepID=UPI0023668A58|nr:MULTISPECIES: tellurite resistance TerB family protein [Pseudovibrio]MDD7911142.1 tellurite resistance TerB family protein [Pseudovibrio exalbescens]MDX5593170.1 tellurite resistance TerB family protein [Pseudovibrio sp. SPO723]
MNKLLSVQEALVHIMVMTAAADSSMTDSELRTIGEVVQFMPVFRGFDETELVRISGECGERMSAENGLGDTLDLIAQSLPSKLYDTGYAVAVEVAAADLRLQQEELRMLQLFRDRFNLDKLTVAAIERGAQARYRTE